MGQRLATSPLELLICPPDRKAKGTLGSHESHGEQSDGRAGRMAGRDPPPTIRGGGRPEGSWMQNTGLVPCKVVVPLKPDRSEKKIGAARGFSRKRPAGHVLAGHALVFAGPGTDARR